MDVTNFELFKENRKTLQYELFKWDTLLTKVNVLSDKDKDKVSENVDKLNIAIENLIILCQELHQKNFQKFYPL